jgi:hypothetical protein
MMQPKDQADQTAHASHSIFERTLSCKSTLNTSSNIAVGRSETQYTVGRDVCNKKNCIEVARVGTRCLDDEVGQAGDG